MDDDSITDADREFNKKLLDEECGHLLTEIERLQMNRQMQDDRVQNVKHLVIAKLASARSLAEYLTGNNSGICDGQYRRQQGYEATFVYYHDISSRVIHGCKIPVVAASRKTDTDFLIGCLRYERHRTQLRHLWHDSSLHRGNSASHPFHHLDHRGFPKSFRLTR